MYDQFVCLFRIGLTRLNFSPYTHEQLTEIVAARLHGLSVFDRDAVNLVARKVSIAEKNRLKVQVQYFNTYFAKNWASHLCVLKLTQIKKGAITSNNFPNALWPQIKKCLTPFLVQFFMPRYLIRSVRGSRKRQPIFAVFG